MPIELANNLTSLLRHRSQRRANLWRITRTDGAILRFTDHDHSIDFGGFTYTPMGGVSPAAYEADSGLETRNTELVGLITSDAISSDDLRAGFYDDAEVVMYRVDWRYPWLGAYKTRRMFIEEIQYSRKGFQGQVVGISSRLRVQVGSLVEQTCDAIVGDDRCRVRLNPPTWQATTAYTLRPGGNAHRGSVVKPTTFNNRHFVCTTAGTSGGSEPSWNTTIGGTTNDGTVVWTTIAALTAPGRTVASVNTQNRRKIFDTDVVAADDFFNQGVVTWLTGDNAGFESEVQRHQENDGKLTLFEKTPFDIVAGDTFDITVGCDRVGDTCINKFDNLSNFRGFRFSPGTDKIIKTPRVKS